MISIPQHVQDKIVAYYSEDLNTGRQAARFAATDLEVVDFRLSTTEDVWTNPDCDSEAPALILEKKKWRPSPGEQYFFLDSDFNVASDRWYSEWHKYLADDARYGVGNAFQTKQQANEAADKIRSLLKGLPK